MAVQVNNGRLNFTSNLDPSGFKQGKNEISRNLRQLLVDVEAYKKAAENAFDKDVISVYNKKIQETQAEINRLKNIGKTGFDEFGNSIKKNTSLVDTFKSTLAKAAVYIGTVFAVQKLIAFGSEVLDVTQKLEGVERAFSRINAPGLLDNLRKATRGTVSDLELMQRAVLANQFNFPVDKLATFFEFATKRARDLGVDSGKFVNDIISGTARGSVRILDNLGISQQAVRAEVKKTGDFTTAVYNIISKQLKDTGEEADTTADKMGRISATITDIEGTIGKSNSGIFAFISDTVQTYLTFLNTALKDTDTRLSELGSKFGVQDNQKLISSFKNDTPEGRASALKGYESLIKKQEQAVADYDKKIQDVSDNLNLLQRIGRSAFTDLNKDLENNRDRQVVLLAEYKSEYNSLLGVQDQEKSALERKKQTDAAQEKERQKQERDRLADLARRNALEQRIADLKNEYTNNSLSNDQKEINSIKDKFSKLSKEVKDFNADPRNSYKASAAGLDAVRDKAIEDLIVRQSLEIEKRNIEAQKSLYKEYEDYKLQVGVKAADERFGKDLGQYKTYISYLKSLLPAKDDNSSAANYLRDFLTPAIAAAQDDEQKQLEEHLTKLLLANATYEQKRTALIERSNEEIKLLNDKGYTEQAQQVQVNTNDELTALAEANFKKLSAYKLLFDNIATLSREETRKNINELYGKAGVQLATGQLTLEAYEKIIKQLDKASLALTNSGTPETLQNIGSAFAGLSNEISGVSDVLSSLVSEAGTALQSIGKLQQLSNNIAQSIKDGSDYSKDLVNEIAIGVSAALSIVGSLVSSAQQRKAAEQAYYNAVISSQNEYNLSLIEQVRLQAQLNANPFLKDYKSDLVAASKSLVIANKEFASSLVALQGGQAKTGTKSVVDGKSVLGNAASGAVLGATIGSAVPVIGTITGAIVGGIGGAILGLFGGKKKVDTLGPLLGIYPDLIKKDKDGIDTINTALAKNLIANNLVSDSTKVLLQNTIDLNDARQAAIDQINNDIKDLAGSLGEDLRNALVQAFESGTDAAKAFGDTVSKVIENIVSQFLFQDIFGSQFDELSKNLKKSFGATGDKNAVDDLTKFFQNSKPLIVQYQAALKAAQSAGKASGFDLFNGLKGQNNSLAGGIQASITEDTAAIIAGTLKGIQLGIYNVNISLGSLILISQNHLNVAIQIQLNTLRTANNSDTLPIMLNELKSINSNSKGSLDVELRAAGFYHY